MVNNVKFLPHCHHHHRNSPVNSFHPSFFPPHHQPSPNQTHRRSPSRPTTGPPPCPVSHRDTLHRAAHLSTQQLSTLCTFSPDRTLAPWRSKVYARSTQLKLHGYHSWIKSDRRNRFHSLTSLKSQHGVHPSRSQRPSGRSSASTSTLRLTSSSTTAFQRLSHGR